MLKHLDLFSGIGGFALACQWAGIETIGFVEIDKYCQKVLRKHWPGVPIVEDIRDIEGIKRIVRGRTVDLVTGGFPCQPFSQSGKQRGIEDDRYLWEEMLGVIKVIKPRWIVCENVVGIINMELDNIISQMGNEGYKTESFIIPALAVSALHERERLWVIAYTDSQRFKECGDKRRTPNEFTPMVQWATESPICGTDDGVSCWVDRLKCLGNAIVPQVAYEIIKVIVEVMEF